MNFNRDKVTTLISEISQALGNLNDLAEREKDAFLEDIHLVSSARYNFIVAIEGMIDICNHFISKNAFRAPKDYADTFTICSENSFFPEQQVKTFASMARFRNRLVHIYWDIDNNELHDILTTRLADFELFIQAVLKKINM